MTKPNFFIVGAPKCGTTAIFDYLKPHPEIFMPAYKEPHYFARDFHGSRLDRFRNGNDYLRLFAHASDAKRIGEASTWYLYSSTAAYEIKDFDPNAKIVAMLRSPVEMMYSLYHQLLYNLNEDLPTFAQALAAEEERKQGKNIPAKLDIMPSALYYRETPKFTQQVKRYFDVFGRENVHVIIYDDMKGDSLGVYRRVLEFLEVDPDFVPEMKIINANKYMRNERVQDFLIAPPNWLMQVGKKVLPVARPVYWKLRNLNSRYQSRPQLEPSLRAELQAEFLPEVEQLSELLGRDLTHWCRD